MSDFPTPDETLDGYPASPDSVDFSSESSTPLDHPSSSSSEGISPMTAVTSPPSPDIQRRVPSLGKPAHDPSHASLSHMSPTSTVTGTLNNARRPAPSAGSLPLDIMQKARALQQQRMGMMGRPPLSTQSSGSGPGSDSSPLQSGPVSPVGGMSPGAMSLGGAMAGNLRMPVSMGGRPIQPGFRNSAPVVPTATGGAKKPPSLSERRAMKLGGLSGNGSPTGGGTPKLSDMNGGSAEQEPAINGEGRGSNLSDFKNYIDAEKGWVTFEGAATITRTGVNFANGQTFSISLDEVVVLDELGKGNYGTVYKVRHSRSTVPRFGQGLSGFKASSRHHSMTEKDDSSSEQQQQQQPMGPSPTGPGRTTSGVVMAMKEIRLELDESKFTTILKELVILHECVSPYIIDFYGAFFQEGAVYMCIEYMDGGSIDKLYGGGIPEPVLRKITYATIMGLKTLKEDHSIIHRDVKPTNILVNTKGQIKICDFGVSGNLVASIAKTNIGCQSYMAPERISGGGMSAAGGAANGTYSVQSDIWSLGLTVIECAMGKYPYPPEVSSTIFSQLSVSVLPMPLCLFPCKGSRINQFPNIVTKAIVEGEPPGLPSEGYSATAQDFVKACVNKVPQKRHTYPMLLAHPWLKSLTKPETITEDAEAEEAATQGGDALADATGKLDLNRNGAVHDQEVADWVRRCLERGQHGGDVPGDDTSAKMKVRPALHAAPLDKVKSVGGAGL